MKISFVIPSYNAVTWLPHAVTSCLEQTHKNIEVIIVDDGSTDKTGEYLDWVKNKDKRINVVRPFKRLGRSAARNLGNSLAQGDVICVLDADDISTPNRADLVIKKFNEGADYVYGNATMIDVLGRPIKIIAADVFDKEKALERMQNGIVHSTAAYTNDFAKRFPYREGEISDLGIDDWAQQIEAKISGAKFDFTNKLLACYRILNSQITKQRSEKLVKEAKERFLAGLRVPA